VNCKKNLCPAEKKAVWNPKGGKEKRPDLGGEPTRFAAGNPKGGGFLFPEPCHL